MRLERISIVKIIVDHRANEIMIAKIKKFLVANMKEYPMCLGQVSWRHKFFWPSTIDGAFAGHH